MTPEQAFLYQSGACADLGSPFMARLMRLLAPRIARGGPIYDRIAAWPGDISPRGASLPLRLAGALHRLVLMGISPELSAVYPPNAASDDELLAAVETALETQTARIDHWLDSPPQTNEVRRSAALIAATHWLAARHPLPVRLSELGASAGLNLAFDRMALELNGRRLGPAGSEVCFAPDWTGASPEPADIQVVDRRGVDLRPVDLGDADDRLRLLSYLWPDQAHRMDTTVKAIDMARALGVTVDAGDAADWLAQRLAEPLTDTLHIVFHTIAWQYFPPQTALACRAALEAAGAGATDRTPLAWLGMEADGQKPGAGLTLRLWPGDVAIPLGRTDFHGRWTIWEPRENQ